MAERKAIQITAVYDHGQAWGNRSPMSQPGTVLIALCDDGSMWTYFSGGKWEPLPPIPSTESEP